MCSRCRFKNGNIRTRERRRPRSEYPHTAAVGEKMAAYASDRHYELVLDQIMVGIWSAAYRAANRSMDV